ncbi:restriction endonuclease subunit S [Ruthenibacterium lactatiformans]|uniref:restriction endonuclease subunit S n=1 Tax=Ruthenibacterium lactatiformans TaxID=1550024 RepID=UPI0032C17952
MANSDNTSGYYIIRQNDFVYNPRKSSDAPYGPISSYKYAEDGIVSPLYLCFHAKGEINPLYYEWYFRSSAWHRYIYMSGDSGARHDRVSIKDDTFFAMPINLPSEQEQSKIASFLQSLDERIAAQEKLVASLKKYKRGVNNQILSQIDNSYNCRLGSVCEIVGGGTPDTLHAEYWGNTVEWFTPSEIGKTKYVNNSVRKLSDIGLDNSSAKLLPIGTVLLTTRATLGEMSIAKRECSTNQGFQSLIPHTDRVSSEYLYYMQIIIKPWCEKYASGNTFREISKSALSDCIIPIPDRARQEQIVKLLSSIDMIIDAAESISMSLSKIRHGLMQQLFI